MFVPFLATLVYPGFQGLHDHFECSVRYAGLVPPWYSELEGLLDEFSWCSGLFNSSRHGEVFIVSFFFKSGGADDVSFVKGGVPKLDLR